MQYDTKTTLNKAKICLDKWGHYRCSRLSVRMFLAQSQQSATYIYRAHPVQLEAKHGCASYRSERFYGKRILAPTKMSVPTMLTRVVQRR